MTATALDLRVVEDFFYSELRYSPTQVEADRMGPRSCIIYGDGKLRTRSKGEGRGYRVNIVEEYDRPKLIHTNERVFKAWLRDRVNLWYHTEQKTSNSYQRKVQRMAGRHLH